MTRAEFMALLSPLVLVTRAEFDKPTWSAYYLALKDIAPAVLQLVVESLLRDTLAFMPKAGEIRGAAEKARRVLLAAHPLVPCAECEDTKGWREIEMDGVRRMQRCPCVGRHQAKLAGLGLAQPVASLPGEASGESEAVYPSLEQLPPAVRQALVSATAQKVLR